jgi:hypothetical protein
MPENPDRTQTPPERERVDVLTNEVAEIIAELIQISWKDGIRQGLDRAAQIADTVARTSDVNHNTAGAVTAEFIRDQLRLEALQT